MMMIYHHKTGRKGEKKKGRNKRGKEKNRDKNHDEFLRTYRTSTISNIFVLFFSSAMSRCKMIISQSSIKLSLNYCPSYRLAQTL